MRRGLRTIEARVLPRGWKDVVRQIAAVRGRVRALPARARAGRRSGGYKPFGDATKIIDLERVAPRVRRAEHPGVGLERALADGHRRLDLPERALLRHARGARVHLPAPQRLVLLRAQHVHDRDGDRARRLRAVPDGAAATDAGVGLHRLDLPVPGGWAPALRQRARRAGVHQLLRGRALDARLLRADDRLADGPAGRAGARQVLVVAVPAAHHLRRRRDRQPLLHRRRSSARSPRASSALLANRLLARARPTSGRSARSTGASRWPSRQSPRRRGAARPRRAAPRRAHDPGADARAADRVAADARTRSR